MNRKGNPMNLHEKIQGSLTLQFAEAVNKRKLKGEKILSLGLGEPDFETPVELFDAVRSSLNSENSRYSASAGLISLRDKIANYLSYQRGINCQGKNILVTPGTKQAIQLTLFSLVEPDDEIIIILPAYVSYVPQVYIAESNAEVRFVHLSKEDYKLDIKQIEEVISPKTKAIILNSPHNPTGVMFDKEFQVNLYELAVKHDFYIISDEIYDKLVFGEIGHFSIGSLENEPERVITVNGFGKSHAITGWRIGYLCASSDLFGKINKINQHINTNTNTFMQKAIELAWPLPEKHLNEYKNILTERTKLYYDFLNNNPNISGSKPVGGFFAFVNISKLKCCSLDFVSKLVEITGVAVTPGIAFGQEWNDHVRVSLAVKTDVLAEAFALITEFIKLEKWK